MIKFIDTHTHLYLPEFDTDRDDIVKRAVSNNVEKMLMPNIDIHSVDLMISVVNRYPNICYPMIGLHPTSVKEDYLSQLDNLEKLVTKHNIVAIGEIGIDLYWDKRYLEEQIKAFRRQIAFAVELGLPVVIHSRESFPEVFDLLKEFEGKDLQGVFHAFTGTVDDAEKAIGMGFKLGIGGIITFKNSGLEETIKDINPENIILETDSPYLAPAPHRGKRNESSYIGIINQKLSDIFGLNEKEMAAITFANSVGLFNL